MVEGQYQERPKRRKNSKEDEEVRLLEDLQKGIMKLLSKDREHRMGMLQRRTRSQHHAPHYSMQGYTGSEGGNSVYQEGTGGDVVAARKKPSRKGSVGKNPFTDEITPNRKDRKRGKTAPP